MLVSLHGEWSGVGGADGPFCRVATNDRRVGPGALIWLPEVPVLAIEVNNYGLVLKAPELCRCEWRRNHHLVMGFWRQDKNYSRVGVTVGKTPCDFLRRGRGAIVRHRVWKKRDCYEQEDRERARDSRANRSAGVSVRFKRLQFYWIGPYGKNCGSSKERSGCKKIAKGQFGCSCLKCDGCNDGRSNDAQERRRALNVEEGRDCSGVAWSDGRISRCQRPSLQGEGCGGRDQRWNKYRPYGMPSNEKD